MENKFDNLIPLPENPFKTLGISVEKVSTLRPDQLLTLIKGMYKVLQTVYHPDKRGSEEESSKINAAFSYLKDNSTNFNTARDLYLNSNAGAQNRFITQINDLEKKISSLEKEKSKKEKQTEKTIATLTSENKRINTSLKTNLGLISLPKGAITPDQYSDFIYTISVSLLDTSNSPKFGSKGFKYDGMYAQILLDGAYHVVGHPRSKDYPPTYQIFSGLDSRALTLELKNQIIRAKHKLDPKLIHKLMFAMRPYLLNRHAMLLHDPKENKFTIYPIQDIIPKSEFKSKRHKVL